MMNEVLQQHFLNNSVQSWIIALGMFLGGLVIIRLFRKILLSALKKWADGTAGRFDDFIVEETRRSIIPLLYYGAFYAALHYLTLSPLAGRVLHVVSLLYLTFFAVRLVITVLRFALMQYLSRQENGEEKQKQVRGVMVIVSAIIWVLGLVFLMDNWGFDVTAIITGLGIGGIAIALATQHILGDLFSYFVILFDRPFEVGDFIIVQDKIGTIEHIGIKTTRVRSLFGEEVVCSNTDLTNSRIHNYKKMERRRIAFKVTVTYQTPAGKSAKIAGMLKQIIDNEPAVTFDRAHLFSFSPSGLEYECVYYVSTGDYNQYMDAQQSINIGIIWKFEEEGIEFAIPTQNVFLQDRQTA
jgi:small-conductance mechanosensitive channel